MARTYNALKVRSQLLMMEEWDSLHPPPPTPTNTPIASNPILSWA